MHLQATASKAATLLARNPALFCRVMLGKLQAARPMPSLPVRKHIGGVIFEYDLEDYRGTAAMYFGSYAPLVVNAMRRILRPGDAFIDVGANIGYLSAVAADLVGTSGAVHCFEPVSMYFSRIEKLAALNPQYRIVANRSAAGDAPGAAAISVTHETGQSTLVSHYKQSAQIAETVHVPVIRLDSYIEAERIDGLSLIKIDVEGFEFPVLRGLQRFFQTASDRPAIICEIAPRAYPLLGYRLADLWNFMASHGYSARNLIDGKTPVDIGEITHVDDVLFVREAK